MTRQRKRKVLRVGTLVRDLHDNVRRIVRVVWTVAYELNSEPDLLYQSSEVKRLAGRRAKKR